MSILKLETLLENQVSAQGELNPNAPHTRLHFASGRTVVLPTELLLEAAREVRPAGDEPPDGEPMYRAEGQRAPDETVIPLVAEELRLGKRAVVTERIRLERKTEEIAEHVSMPLQQISWEVEHVPMGQVVTERPESRQVGDVIIFPVLEERLVVATELFLREEVHLRKVVTTVEKSADFTLKRDVLVETHLKGAEDGEGQAQGAGS